MEKQDIKNTKDVEQLVDTFYAILLKDSILGDVFNNYMSVELTLHLPNMYSFWNAILFQKSGFNGNPMRTHILLNERIKLTKEHFDQWIMLWNKTIDSSFNGPLASLAKEKAASMRMLMEYKIGGSSLKTFIQ